MKEEEALTRVVKEMEAASKITNGEGVRVRRKMTKDMILRRKMAKWSCRSIRKQRIFRYQPIGNEGYADLLGNMGSLDVNSLGNRRSADLLETRGSSVVDSFTKKQRSIDRGDLQGF